MAAAWPERAGDPFAYHMNNIRKYVVTDTLTDDQLTAAYRRKPGRSRRDDRSVM